MGNYAEISAGKKVVQVPDRGSFNDIDWNEMWKNAKLNSTWRRLFGDRDAAEYWDRRAPSFDRNARDGRGEARVEELIRRFGIDSHGTVLDIGAGTGRLAVPLARVAGSVTAVEPSGGMADILLRNAEAEGIDNIEVIRRRWEDVEAGRDVGEHHVVLASHSLGMLDIVEALRKMDSLAGRFVCIYTFGSTRIWDFSALWPRLYGEEFVPGPSHIYLVNALHSMGISANVEVVSRRIERRYGSVEDALHETKIRLDIRDSEKDDTIRSFLEGILREEEDVLVQHHDFEEVMVWWEK